MTAHAIKGYREKCLEAGMDDYVAKPVRGAELLAVVEKWIIQEDSDGARFNEDATCPDLDQGAAADLAEVDTGMADAPMDYARALSEFENDEEFLREVLDGFLDNVRRQIQVLRQALAAGDAETVAREAHSVKGGAANLAADALAAAARDLENMGRVEGLSRGEVALDSLCREYDRFNEYVRRHA